MSGNKADGGWAAKAGDDAKKENNSGQDGARADNKDDTTGTGQGSGESDEDTNDTADKSTAVCKTWLEVLPSKGGMLLAVLLAEIMTEGLSPNQMATLGSFISTVGSLISYKSVRDDLDFP